MQTSIDRGPGPGGFAVNSTKHLKQSYYQDRQTANQPQYGRFGTVVGLILRRPLVAAEGRSFHRPRLWATRLLSLKCTSVFSSCNGIKLEIRNTRNSGKSAHIWAPCDLRVREQIGKEIKNYLELNKTFQNLWGPTLVVPGDVCITVPAYGRHQLSFLCKKF